MISTNYERLEFIINRSRRVLNSFECRFVFGCLATLGMFCGCRSAETIRDPEFSELHTATMHSSFNTDGVEAAQLPIVSELSGPHTVDEYITVALAQNPRIQAARKRI